MEAQVTKSRESALVLCKDLLMFFLLFSLWTKQIQWPGSGIKNSEIHLLFLDITKVCSEEEKKLVSMFTIYHREYEREIKTKSKMGFHHQTLGV